jgi:hypothetical protein
MGLKDSQPNLIALLLKDARATLDKGYDDSTDTCLRLIEVIEANPITCLAIIAMLARFAFFHASICLRTLGGRQLNRFVIPARRLPSTERNDCQKNHFISPHVSMHPCLTHL